MSEEWPNLGPAYEIDGFVEPMRWGTSTYTIIRMPTALVEAAQAAGTRRVGGTLCYDLADRLTATTVTNPVAGANSVTDGFAAADIGYDARGNTTGWPTCSSATTPPTGT